MNRQELLALFKKYASNTDVRQVISTIISKAGQDSIEQEIMRKIPQKALDLKAETVQIRELLGVNNAEDKLLLQTAVEFYFINVKEAI